MQNFACSAPNRESKATWDERANDGIDVRHSRKLANLLSMSMGVGATEDRYLAFTR